VYTPHIPGTEQVFTTNTIILRYTQKIYACELPPRMVHIPLWIASKILSKIGTQK